MSEFPLKQPIIHTKQRSFTSNFPPSVPFLESPKFVPKRRESSHTLPLPSLQSHPLLRANSDNTMTQSDPLAFPSKPATNPHPAQVTDDHGVDARMLAFVIFMCDDPTGPAQGLYRDEKLQQPKNSHTLALQRTRRAERHRGETPTAKRKTGVRSLWRDDALCALLSLRLVVSYSDHVF